MTQSKKTIIEDYYVHFPEDNGRMRFKPHDTFSYFLLNKKSNKLLHECEDILLISHNLLNRFQLIGFQCSWFFVTQSLNNNNYSIDEDMTLNYYMNVAKSKYRVGKLILGSHMMKWRDNQHQKAHLDYQ